MLPNSRFAFVLLFILSFLFYLPKTGADAENLDCAAVVRHEASLIIDKPAHYPMHSAPQSHFRNGSGTVEDPFLVGNAAELNAIRYHLDKHFKQTANIDLGVPPWNLGNGWEPIGNRHARFTGSYDGGNYIIKNLTINRPLDRDLGLFAQLAGALIKNLILKNVQVSGYYMVGSLAGKAIQNSRIAYVVVVNANLNIQNRFCGGLIGNIDDANIFRCQVSGTINRGAMFDWNFIGGLFGTITSSTTGLGSLVEECFSTVRIISQSHNTCGGLTGALWYNGIINNSYARGSVIASNEFAGGFVGDVSHGQPKKLISNSYSTSYVRAKGSDVHGFAGRAGNGKFEANFWDIDKSGQSGANYPAAAGKSSKEMKLKETFKSAGWDFDETWAIDPQENYNDGYPYLQWQLVYEMPKHLQKTSINATEALIEWTKGAVETEWELAWGYHGFNPRHDSVHIVSSSQQFFMIEGLYPATVYDVYIRAVYPDQYGMWAGPVRFKTKSIEGFINESTTADL